MLVKSEVAKVDHVTPVGNGRPLASSITNRPNTNQLSDCTPRHTIQLGVVPVRYRIPVFRGYSDLTVVHRAQTSCPGKLWGVAPRFGTVIIGPDHDGTIEPENNALPTDSHMTVPFQNEYLYAALSDSAGSEGSQKVLCTVPDLISILGRDGEGIGSQDLRYGLRVTVIALPAHPLWKTDKGLAVGRPEGFGLKVPVVGVDVDFTKARSVIKEFDCKLD